MRIQALPSRPANYIDRNPTPVAMRVELTGVAPHGWTNRVAYTVPSGKAAFVEFVSITITRRDWPTLDGTASAYVEVGDDSTGWATVVYPHLSTVMVQDTVSQYVTGVGYLREGQQIKAWTVDTSTGGTVDYYITIKVTEFDA